MVCGTNEVVDVVLLHLVQADLQQHGDGSETRQGHVVYLLAVGLQEGLTE